MLMLVSFSAILSEIIWANIHSGNSGKTELKKIQKCIHFHLHEIKLICIQFSSVAQSCLTLMTPWPVAHQTPLSMRFSRQEYWSVATFYTRWIFPTQGLNPCHSRLLHWQADSLLVAPPGKPPRN